MADKAGASGPPKKLTKQAVDAAKPQGRDYILWDPILKGFGLKVTPAGRKVFLVQYRMRVPDKPLSAVPPKKYTIGEYGQQWTPDQARHRADDFLRLVARGTDPVAQEREELAARQKEQMEMASVVARTFEAVCERYLAEQVRPRLKRAKQTEGQLHKHFLPYWKSRDIGDIKRADVMGVLRGLEAAGSSGAARKALAEVRALFNYAVTLELISANPAAGRNIIATRYEGRERALSGVEIGEVWHAAETLGYPFGPLIKMLILTGQRLNEVAGVPWSEFDFTEGLWAIQPARVKMKREHIVHLSPQAMAVLRSAADSLADYLELPRDESGVVPFEVVAKHSPFAFTTTLRTPVSGLSRAKVHLDKAIAKARAKAADGGEVQEMHHWTYHDFRRTFSTACAQRGIPSHVVEKVLNHNPSALKGVAAIYNRYEYISERKAVIEDWGRVVEEIASGTPAPSNVIKIHRVAQ